MHASNGVREPIDTLLACWAGLAKSLCPDFPSKSHLVAP